MTVLLAVPVLTTLNLVTVAHAHALMASSLIRLPRSARHAQLTARPAMPAAPVLPALSTVSSPRSVTAPLSANAVMDSTNKLAQMALSSAKHATNHATPAKVLVLNNVLHAQLAKN